MTDKTLRRLVLADVGLALDARPLFEGLDLDVGPERVTTVMGPSGCGKSALLAFVCGTLARAFTATGRVWMDGHDVTGLAPERRRVGILYQDDLLFPHMSVGENLAFGLPRRGADGRRTTRAERRRRVEKVLGEADLAGMADRDPATLSGGQRARVALMRALLSEPCALLLDEPFAKLDVPLRARVRAFVFEHARRNRIPTLLVTHDPADAESAGGPVIELARAGAPGIAQALFTGPCPAMRHARSAPAASPARRPTGN